MRRSSKYGLAAAVACSMAVESVEARAEEPDPQPVVFSAFGTLGITHSTEGRADFTSTTYQPRGAGYSRAWSPSVDSRLGAQLAATASPSLSAVLQVVAEQNYDNRYTPHVEWANLKYEFTPDINVRIGRIALTTSLVNDTRKVGYANPWARPPREVYNLVPVTNNDGIDASYRSSIGAAVNTLQIAAGRLSTDFPGAFGGMDASTVKFRKSITLSETLEYGPFTARLSAARGLITIPQVAPLFDGFRQFGAEGAAVADRYDLHDRPVVFVGIGGSYDPGAGFVMAEWGQTNSPSLVGRSNGWYATGGYRFGRFTPYVTFGRSRSRGRASDPGLSVTALPPMAAGVATALNAALNTSLAARTIAERTWSLGTRWDFAKNAALKVQFDRVHNGTGSVGYLVNVQPGLPLGGSASVFTVNVDFVY